MNHLNKRRDELAEKICADFDEYENMAFKDGFDAAITELQPEIDRLVEALDCSFLEHLKEELRLSVDETDIGKLQGIIFSVSHGLIVAINNNKEAIQKWREFKGE